MNTFAGWGLSIILATLGLSIPSRAQTPVESPSRPTSPNLVHPIRINDEKKSSTAAINFAWGDVSWLPRLAAEAGWPQRTHKRLAQIILRESGGCPNRRGGDTVDDDCNITGVSDWSHRSDTGLLQINGVNYDPSRNKWAIACRELNICTQEPLLDPLVNLRVGYLLFKEAGWGPWDPCAWGPEYAHRCNKKP
ncbi:MAG: hypothetical protein EBU84_11865 [Actinobacteria bacterium]|nr:hypothetical protein [Actinomycetota bacterium]